LHSVVDRSLKYVYQESISTINWGKTMKSEKAKKEIQILDPANNATGFNFEQWAQQVRPLLLASLQKRGSR